MAALVLGRDDKLMLAAEVADLLDLTPATIRWYANAGDCPRIEPAEVCAFFQLSDVQDFERKLLARKRDQYGDGWDCED